MNNFDLKKYLAKNPLTEAYTPGSGWTQDFDYDDMLAQGLKVNVNTPVEDLEKMFADFEDVNYHREGEPLSYAIDAIKAGDRGEAKMYINKFHKELKKTIADYSDEYFDVNEEKLHENMFDVDTTEKIAQAIANAFTADDELDLKYTVHPGTEESSFDLDVEAGPNTPGPEWKDKNGFGIDNYLGEFAGGSFYIKDGVVYNAASRNAPVANVTPEGEVEMISAADSRAAIDSQDDIPAIDRMYNSDAWVQAQRDAMEESKEEKKSNKMKKSELKEIIRAAFLNETEEKVEEGTWAVLPARIPEFIQAVEDLKDEYHGVVGSDDVFNGLDAAISAAEELLMNTAEIREAEGDEEVDVEADAGETADTDVETTDVAVDDTETVDVETTTEISPEVKATQDALTAAIEAAKALGDEKLADQIGNSITFFTRTHVVGADKVNENIDLFSTRLLKNAGIKK